MATLKNIRPGYADVFVGKKKLGYVEFEPQLLGSGRWVAHCGPFTGAYKTRKAAAEKVVKLARQRTRGAGKSRRGGRRAGTGVNPGNLSHALAASEVEVGSGISNGTARILGHVGIKITPQQVIAAVRDSGDWYRDPSTRTWKPRTRELKALYDRHAAAFYEPLHRNDPRLDAASWDIVKGHMLKRFMAGNYAVPQPATVRKWIGGKTGRRGGRRASKLVYEAVKIPGYKWAYVAYRDGVDVGLLTRRVADTKLTKSPWQAQGPLVGGRRKLLGSFYTRRQVSGASDYSISRMGLKFGGKSAAKAAIAAAAGV